MDWSVKVPKKLRKFFATFTDQLVMISEVSKLRFLSYRISFNFWNSWSVSKLQNIAQVVKN